MKETQLQLLKGKKSSSYQPTKAELEADVSIPTTPDKLLRSVIDYSPPKPSK